MPGATSPPIEVVGHGFACKKARRRAGGLTLWVPSYRRKALAEAGGCLLQWHEPGRVASNRSAAELAGAESADVLPGLLIPCTERFAGPHRSVPPPPPPRRGGRHPYLWQRCSLLQGCSHSFLLLSSKPAWKALQALNCFWNPLPFFFHPPPPQVGRPLSPSVLLPPRS